MNGAAGRVSLDEIFAVPVAGRWLLFSPRTWTSALVNEAAVDAVAHCANGGAARASESIRALYRQLAFDPVPFTETAKPTRKLVIIPTRACNMSCVYCDFAASGAPRAVLDPRLACRLFDSFSRDDREARGSEMRVHFFGGEPMVARKCVETIIHYVRSSCARTDAVPWFEVTTNGLFDSTAVPLLGDYVDSLVVSVDGDRALHDRHRVRPDGTGTFDRIAANLRSLREYPVKVSLRACVTGESVGRMKEIAAHLWEEFHCDVLCFEMLADNAGARRAGLSPPAPFEFAEGVLKAERMLSRNGARVVHGPSECTGPRRTSCPLGQGTLMLHPDGVLSGCYLDPHRWEDAGMDLTFGRVSPENGVSVDRGKVRAVAEMIHRKPRCARCFCRFTCAGGCHVDQTPPGCPDDVDDRCRAIRMITAIRLVGSMEGWDLAMRLLSSEAAVRALADLPDDRLVTRARKREVGAG